MNGEGECGRLSSTPNVARGHRAPGGGPDYASRVDASPVELRVLGCLIEKQRTTPDAYPLSLNALRLACNQSTNRDPVVDYAEETIRGALQRLGGRGWTRLASGPGSRAVKYRHLFGEALGLDDGDLALLAVLMLRGPQTLGELKSRTERLHRFDSLAVVEEALIALGERGLVARLPRRPGQKEERFAQLLGGESGEVEESVAAPAAAPVADDRLTRLERRVDALEGELAELRARTG